METLPMKLERSRTALSRHSRKLAVEALGAGTAFVEQTRDAGQALVVETRSAGRNFTERARAAHSMFLTRTRSAGEEWLREMRSEADAWRNFIRARPGGSGGRARAELSPEQLQRKLLMAAHQVLSRLDDRIAHRLGYLQVERRQPAARPVEMPSRRQAAPKTRPAAPPRNATTRRSSRPPADRPPLRGYDEMTAKQLVSRLDALSREQLRAVVTYERANKQRATVLRAAEQRLAA